MEFKIGDKVKVRDMKDLYCEYGDSLEPYPNDPLGFNHRYSQFEGIIESLDSYRGHTMVSVNYSTNYNDSCKYLWSWWYYPEVLIKVEEGR